ncbi:hypothetical protein GCM10007853_06400 [Algimonas ampicilliniresistens]|uniref:DUF3168 domain-containing protein n=1 Tax=Algimonas ampicilliniresistens TaxID=1298735 RepID=A0ABQ5V5G4_9PROT|nr:DUF3168 domain-containing protein [Algimonas ampicilliniresistens]GLQ22766.1 hypothetical protein GCM10007853_06400 [Algimonas ampicilliniresistens]
MSALNLAADALIMQQTLHAALANDLAVTATLGDPIRAFDDTPDDPVYPYLTYGQIRSEDTSGDAAPQSTHQMTLHLWSRYAGRAEVFDLLRMVSDTIRDSVPHTVLPLYTDVFRAPDGRTFHGLLRLSVTLTLETTA